MSQGARPNVVLITTDQQRYDTLGCNGAEMVRTPVLDAIAAEGVRFERPYVNNPVCIPSRACIQTGRYTHQHGVRYMENRVNDTPGLPMWETTFMEYLQANGYRTCGTGKLHMFPPKGLDVAHLTNGQGARWTTPYGSPYGPAQLGDDYAAWLEAKRPGAYAQIYEQRRSEEYKRYMSAVTSVLSTDETVDYWAMEKAIEFIEDSKDQPFFLWLGFCNPHGPVDAPAEYATMYDPAQIELSEKAKRGSPSGRRIDPGLLRRWIAHYWGLCTMLDDLTGKVVDTLKRLGLWENTLFIFTSDHGEMMGDFGRFGKANFYEPVIRVPLIVKPPAGSQGAGRGEDAGGSAAGPGQRRWRPGAVVSDLVELIDIAPTILDYAGARIPSSIQGRSLRTALEGGSHGKEAILCEYTSNNQDRHGKCLRTERYKFVYWAPSGERELYDLQEDPDEFNNLANDRAYAALRMEMQDRLLDHLAMTERPILAR
mgnify:CR=1 FL=1